MKSLIQGIGLTGGFGCSQADLLTALARATSPPQWQEISGPSGTRSVPALLATTTGLAHYLSRAALRRLSHYSRMALLAAYMALDDAGALTRRPDRLGIIVATGYGSTGSMPDAGSARTEADDLFGSPTRFAGSVHNATAGYLAMALKETGPNLTVCQYDMSVPQALLTAQLWLAEDRVEAVLVGAVDGFCHELATGMCGGASSEDVPGRAVPIGEGSAFVLLRSARDGAAGYALLGEVEMGREKCEGRRVKGEGGNGVAVGVLGVNGYGEGEERISALLPPAARVVNYAGIYGALPVGLMFDGVIAALALHHGTLWPAARPLPELLQASGWQGRLLAAPGPPPPEGLICVTTGVEGLYARIAFHPVI